MWNMNSCYYYNYVKIKASVENLKNLFANMCLQLIWRPGFKLESCSENVKQGRFQRDFEAMTEKTDFFTE